MKHSRLSLPAVSKSLLLTKTDFILFQATLHQEAATPGPRTHTGPWPVRNLAAQQEVSGWGVSEASSAAARRSASLALLPKPSPHPGLWKNCLPRNRSLVPKRLGTAALHQTYWKLKKGG